MCQAVLTAHRH